MSAGSGTFTWLPVRALAKRELVRFYRQKSRIIGSLATPLLFWLFLGSGLSAAFPTPSMPGGRGYLEYFFPGILVLTILFTSIFSNISLIEDRHEGFLQSVLVAPVTRLSMVGGKAIGGTLLALLQGVLLLCLAPLAGFSLSVTAVALAIVAMTGIALTLSTLGFLFAWRLDSIQGFHSIMNVVLMPMWLLSGSFFPASRAPFVLKPIMYLNPLTYGYAALQQALYWDKGPVESVTPLPVALAAILGFGVVFFCLAALAVAKRPNEVST